MGEIRVDEFGGPLGIEQDVHGTDVALVAALLLQIPEAVDDRVEGVANPLLRKVLLC